MRSSSRYFAETAIRIAIRALTAAALVACGAAAEPTEADTSRVPAVPDSSLSDSASLAPDTVESAEEPQVPMDTVLYEPGNVLDVAVPVTDSTDYERLMYQQPTKALFKSMLFPGWGQLGNRSYFKAALYFGLDVWFVGSAIHYGRQAADFRDQYESVPYLPPGSDGYQENYIKPRNDLYELYEARKDQRNKFTWLAVFVTFISMFDAYVDAHLSGFPQSESQQALFDIDLRRDEAGVAAIVTLRF